MISELRQRVYDLLDHDSPHLGSRLVDASLISLILVNSLAVVMETVPGVHGEFGYFFRELEAYSIAVFTVEYILRIWSCTANPRFRRPLRGRVRYALTPFALLDLVAILPYYLPILLPYDFRVLRMMRLMRLLFLLKIARHSDSLRTLGNVLLAKSEELMICIFVLFILLVMDSSMMYYLEHEAQPKVFSSIPAAMWWGVVTLTTVGYGDVYPITVPGKILAAFTALLGIGMFALPAGILGSGFVEEMQKRRSGRRHACPHCGKDTRG